MSQESLLVNRDDAIDRKSSNVLYNTYCMLFSSIMKTTKC